MQVMANASIRQTDRQQRGRAGPEWEIHRVIFSVPIAKKQVELFNSVTVYDFVHYISSVHCRLRGGAAQSGSAVCIFRLCNFMQGGPFKLYLPTETFHRNLCLKSNEFHIRTQPQTTLIFLLIILSCCFKKNVTGNSFVLFARDLLITIFHLTQSQVYQMSDFEIIPNVDEHYLRCI